MVKKILGWLITGLKNSFTFDGRLRLPSKPVLWIFGALAALLILTTVPQSVISAYQHSIAGGATAATALGQALLMTGLLTLLFGMMIGIYFYMLCFLCSVVIPDLVALTKALWRGIKKIPAAFRAVVHALGATAAFIWHLPSRWRAMSDDDRGLAKFMVVTLTLMGAIGYGLWPVAHGIYNWLPAFFQLDPWWMGTAFIDVVLCLFAVHILIAIAVPVIRLFRPRRDTTQR